MSDCYSVSLSGGKDSTAMLLRLLEENRQVDDIVFFDTGWEFPQMLEHIERVEDFIGRKVTRLCPPKSFEWRMMYQPIIRGQGKKTGDVYRIGNGWPSMNRRWCTQEKMNVLRKYTKGAVQCIGIASDEIRRMQSTTFAGPNRIYPLIEWDMTEADCLAYCKDRGFDWGGLYQKFTRVSCFCCPFQRVGELRTLRREFPDLWQKMLDWDARIDPNRGFRGYDTVHDLEIRFSEEDRQLRFEWEESDS